MLNRDAFVVFAGSADEALAKQITKILQVDLGRLLISTFPDKEIGVEVLDNVRGRDVFAVQAIARRPNHYLMELLITIDALKRASARSICAVIPYFGYARQDRKDRGRVPITAKLVANLLQTAGVDRVLTMDLHAEQIEGFFDVPVDNLHARDFLVKAVKKELKSPFVVVAPDLGSIKWARAFASQLGKEIPFAVFDKRRVNAEHVETDALIGDVEDRDVLLVDDLVSTGATLKVAAHVCKRRGAKRIFATFTHGLFTSGAFAGSAIEKIWVTDTVPLPPQFEKNVEVVSVAPLFAEAIESILLSKSISSLYHK